MKRLFFFLLISLTFCLSNLLGQIECETKITPEHRAYMQKVADGKMKLKKGKKTDRVGLVFHILHDGGVPVLSRQDVIESMKDIKKAFAPICEMYIADIVFHNFPDAYNNFNHTDYGQKIIAEQYKNAINIVTSKYSGGCGYAWYPSGTVRYAFVDEDCFKGANTTTIHEIGHFLNVYHTHGTVNGIAELVDGSNCGIGVGDECCDTPADPRINRSVTTDCVYDGDFRDANGDEYDPSTKNYMSYSRQSCRTEFTQQQYERMEITLNGIYSNLRNGKVSPPTSRESDLIIDASLTNFKISGRKITIKTGAKNIGSLTTPEPCYLGYYASKDAMYDPSDFLLHSDLLEGKIKSGRTNTENERVEIPQEYNYIILVADHTGDELYGKIKEENEENNTFVSPRFFGEPPSPPQTCIPCEKLLELCK